MSHASAVSACSQYGSHLVFIESQEEQDFVGGAGKNRWIGLTGSSLSDARWLDGSSLTYTNFDNLSFDNNGNCFRFVYLYPYRWHVKECSRQFTYICEKEVGI
eukprot:XP_011672101.1 PREDICTED: brevican core protein-like [Strongylocentrotus purpuratus]